MNRLKMFVENFVIFGLGGMISQLVPIIMIPIVTRMLPDMGYYGISDLSNTLVSFGGAIGVMGMYDAMYRMFFEKETDEDYKKQVCSTALVFTVGTSFLVSLTMVLGRRWIARIFFGDSAYSGLIFIIALSTFAGGINSIIAAPTRMENKRAIYILANSLSPLIAYTISTVLILRNNYVTALPLGAAISGVLMGILFFILNHKWFVPKKFNKGLLGQLLRISIPLFPNFLIYWIFNSSDRLMITNLMSIKDAGIYSVGAKLGHVSQLIYMAFAGGWQFFAFSTMKEKDQVQTNSLVFEYLGVISYTACCVMCILAYPLFHLLFEGDTVSGYIVSPYLFLAPLLQMLFQVASNQFLVIKKTWPILLILGQGAVLNVLLNGILIPRIGIEGAAIATLLGYAWSDLICIVVLKKMGLMAISRRFTWTAILLFVYMIGWRLLLKRTTGMSLAGVLLFFMYVVWSYKKEVGFLFGLGWKRKK